MKINLYNLTKYVVFILIIIYYLQGVIYNQGNIIGKISILFLLSIAAIFFILSFNYIKRPVINAIFLLIILNLIYYLFSSNQFSITANYMSNISVFNTTSAIKEILFNLLLFFVSFYLTIKNKISDKDLIVFFLCVFILTILKYFTSARTLSAELGRDEFINNISYNFIHLLPFIFFIKRKYLSIILLFISLIFIMFSAKRGAIIIGIFFTFFYVYKIYFKDSRKILIRNIFFSIFVFLIATMIIYNIYNDNVYLQFRMEQTMMGSSSGRDVIFTKLWHNWIDGSNNLLNLLFGFGFAASVKISGSFAHNDWLELLTMAGILGVIIYFIFFMQLIAVSKKQSISIQDKNIIISIILIWFLKSLFSMGYSDLFMFPISILLGYIIARNTNNINCHEYNH